MNSEPLYQSPSFVTALLSDRWTIFAILLFVEVNWDSFRIPDSIVVVN